MDFEDEDLELTVEENDRFWAWLRESGELAALNAWLASLPAEPEPGRNDRCPCGSGVKYKRCCGRGI
jgi:uncharacterized protein YecA (UPF0149 family)